MNKKSKNIKKENKWKKKREKKRVRGSKIAGLETEKKISEKSKKRSK